MATKSGEHLFRCAAPVEGTTCDLQPGHGGDMHSGLVNGIRRWFRRDDGSRVHFGKR